MIQMSTLIKPSRVKSPLSVQHHNNHSPPWVDLVVLICCSLAIFFFRLGSVGLMDASDTYFAEGAREMIENKNYLLPIVNYQVCFSKPALMFWLIASAYHVFGINEFAARFWSAVSATLLVLMSYWTGRCLGGRTTGILAGLICLTTPLLVTFAHLSYTDITYSCFLGVSLFALVMTLCVGNHKWWSIFYIALALSVLIKGPAGIIFLIGAFPIYLILRRPSIHMLGKMFQIMHPLGGSLIFLLIVVPWFVAVGIASEGLWPKVFFLLENFARFGGTTNLNVGKSAWWYYFTVLPYAFFPWVLFLPSAIKAAFSSAGAMPPLPADDGSPLPTKAGRREALTILASYFISVFVLLNISKTQMLYYILPSLAPAAVLVALKMQQWIEFGEEHNIRRLQWLKLSSFFLSICGVVCLVGVSIILYAVPNLPYWMKVFSFTGAVTSAVGLVFQFAWLNAGQIKNMFLCLSATLVSAVASFCPVVFEVAYQNGQSSLVEIAKELSYLDGRVAIYNSNNIAPLFYLKRPLDCLFCPDLLVPNQLTGDRVTPPQYVIANVAHAHELTKRFGSRMRPIIARGPWKVYEAVGLSARRYTPLAEVYKLGLWELMRDGNKFGPLVNPISGGPYFHGKPANGNLQNLEWKAQSVLPH